MSALQTQIKGGQEEQGLSQSEIIQLRKMKQSIMTAGNNFECCCKLRPGFSKDCKFKETIGAEFEDDSGPKNIPRNVKKGKLFLYLQLKLLTESDIWQLFFPPDLISTWTEKTNEWFRLHNIRTSRGKILLLMFLDFIKGKSPLAASHQRWLSASFLIITTQDMLNYLALEYATAFVAMKNLRWYWKTKNNCDGLLGNSFFKNTMSVNKFLIIRQGFQADINEFMNHYSAVARKYYNPAISISIDDDLDKCESRTDERIHLSRKA
jgi:hypothetical protein